MSLSDKNINFNENWLEEGFYKGKDVKEAVKELKEKLAIIITEDELYFEECFKEIFGDRLIK